MININNTMLEQRQINDYKIEDIVGEGAFGKVYRAEGADANTYAIKLIPINRLMKDSIRQQGLLLASMKHPNILWAREFFFFDKEKYFVIVTDYCKEGSLDNHIGFLAQDKIRPVMLGIAEGLRYLHTQKNIVHRDLKPQNILMDGTNPKIADLGIAKVLKRYRASTRIGTPVYMAEEMYQGDYDVEVDVWALGIIFLQLLVGKRIFELLKGEEIPCKMKVFPTNEMVGRISDEKMRTMIREMMKKDPKERIDIQTVVSYLKDQSVTSKKAKTQYEIKSSKFRDNISECYSKINDYQFCKYSLKYVKQLLEKNMLQIEDQAQEGNAKAQYLLAKMYDLGCAMPLNKNKAKEWFLKAYAQQQSHSCYELYVDCAEEKQKKHYINNGLALQQIRCQYRQAESCLEGLEGHQKDYQEAAQLIELLCEKEYPKAYKLKGKLQSKKNTEFYSQEGMIKSYRTGVNLGDIGCMIGLGQQLYKQKLYKQSLELGVQIQKLEELQQSQLIMAYQIKAKAYSKLGEDQRAIDSFKKCIQIDDGTMEKDFRGELASVYEATGQNQQAINWFNEAIYHMVPKFEQCQFYKNRLKKICEQVYIILCEEKMYQNAFTIASMSADLGFDYGKADKASMIYGGLGVAQDKQKGLQMLKELVKGGNVQAKSYLQDIDRGKTV